MSKANLPKRNHEAIKGVSDVILISSTTCGAILREAAALERDDPGPDVMPDSRHAPIISHIVVRRRRVLGVDVDVKKSAMPAEASGEGICSDDFSEIGFGGVKFQEIS